MTPGEKQTYDIIFMRHADHQIQDALDGNHGGSAKGHLTPFGFFQSYMAGRLYADMQRLHGLPKLKKIYSSGVERADETVDVFNTALTRIGGYKEPVEVRKVFPLYDHPANALTQIREDNPNSEGMILAIVHEPFLKKLFGSRGEHMDNVSGFITNLEFPQDENSIKFIQSAPYDSEAINLYFGSIGRGDKYLGRDLTFAEFKDRLLSSAPGKRFVNDYRIMHKFATQTDKDNFIANYPMDFERLFEYRQIRNTMLYEWGLEPTSLNEQVKKEVGSSFFYLFIDDKLDLRIPLSTIQQILDMIRYKVNTKDQYQ